MSLAFNTTKKICDIKCINQNKKQQRRYDMCSKLDSTFLNVLGATCMRSNRKKNKQLTYYRKWENRSKKSKANIHYVFFSWNLRNNNFSTKIFSL